MTEKINKSLFNEAVVVFLAEYHDDIIDALYNEAVEAGVIGNKKRKDKYEFLMTKINNIHNIVKSVRVRSASS